MASLVSVATEVGTLLTGVTTLIGAENVGRSDPPPRVVWVPTKDRFGEAQRYGQGTSKGPPRSVGTIIAGVEVRLLAVGLAADADPYKDMRAVEALRDRFLFMLRKVAYGSYRLREGGFMLATDGDYGRGYVLELELMLPITSSADETYTTATVTNVTQRRGTMDFPSSDVSGEPAP